MPHPLNICSPYELMTCPSKQIVEYISAINSAETEESLYHVIYKIAVCGLRSYEITMLKEITYSEF